MNLWHGMSLSLMVIALCGHFVNAWDQASRDQILKIQNDYRKAVPGACDLKPMRYDRQLENEAKAWAQRCVFEHQMKSRGENIAWQTLGDPEPKLLKILAAMWHGEVKDFTYGQKSCGAACHYTQLVWAKTTKVGCYGHKCSNLQGGGPNAYFLVCFYSPAGNMEGEDPYKTTCGADNIKKGTQTNSGNSNSNHNNNNNNNNNNGNNAGASSSDDGWGDWESGDSNNGWENWDSGNSNDGWENWDSDSW